MMELKILRDSEKNNLFTTWLLYYTYVSFSTFLLEIDMRQYLHTFAKHRRVKTVNITTPPTLAGNCIEKPVRNRNFVNNAVSLLAARPPGL